MATTRAQAKAQSVLALKYVIALFEDPIASPILKALDEVGVETVNDFLATPSAEFIDFTYTVGANETEEERPLNKKQLRAIRQIHSWLKWEKKRRNVDEFGQLTLEDYDEFQDEMASLDDSSTATPQPHATTAPSIVTTTTSVSTFRTNVKVDVKQYPVFNGDIAHWSKFKRGVLALAATHGLDDVFDGKFVVPIVSDPHYGAYQEKNRFVYSIWISRITAGLALSTLREFEDDKDGRGAYFKFLEIYEGKHNMAQVAMMAMDKLNRMYLTYNYPGGASAFIGKFREALQDLKDAKEPMSDAMTKTLFLTKIQDNTYKATVNCLRASQKDDFEACVTRILDEFNMNNHSKSNHGNRQSNKVQTNKHRNRRQNNNANRATNNPNNSNSANANKSSSNSPHGNNNGNQRQSRVWIEPEIWNKLTSEQSQALLQLKRNNNSNNNNQSQDNRNRSLSPQRAPPKVTFGQNTTRYRKRAEIGQQQDNEEEDDIDLESIIKPRINSIMQSTRRINAIMVNSSMSEIRSYGLIDSGADTCMLSYDDFYVESQYDHCQVSVEGFDGPWHVQHNFRIGNGITAVDLPNITLLLRINEGVFTSHKSIISANQVRSYGHRVDDVPLRYGGGQKITLDFHDFEGGFPLVYRGALCYMPMRRPTRKEVIEGDILDLTSGEI
ncbi:MAG TPA: hypothetical protein V6D48_01555 [Oculatellaceae cyanobacterium]